MRCGCVGRAPQGPGLPGRVSMPSSSILGREPLPQEVGGDGAAAGGGRGVRNGPCVFRAGLVPGPRGSTRAGEGGAGARAALSGSHSPPTVERTRGGGHLPVGLGSCQTLSWSWGARRFDSPGAGERSGRAERRTRWARGWERKGGCPYNPPSPPSGPTRPAHWEPPESSCLAPDQPKSLACEPHPEGTSRRGRQVRPRPRRPPAAGRGAAGGGGVAPRVPLRRTRSPWSRPRLPPLRRGRRARPSPAAREQRRDGRPPRRDRRPAGPPRRCRY